MEVTLRFDRKAYGSPREEADAAFAKVPPPPLLDEYTGIVVVGELHASGRSRSYSILVY